MAASPNSSAAPASDATRAEWRRRVEAEYRSAALTQHLGLWLIQMGAPPELIADSRRVVGDEMIHAEMSHEVFVAAGGSGAPGLNREALALPRTRAPLEHDVLRAGVEIFCLGETVAVRLFQRLRQRCTVPPARRALDRILRDEVRHRDFGWTLLEWMLATPNAEAYRKLLADELPAMLRRVRRNYGEERPRGAPEPAFAESDRAWGLMPLSDYRDAVTETFARDYGPRFAGLGIESPG